MARSGMAGIIVQVRQLAACGASDYTAAGYTWWTDDQIQTHLDRTRAELWAEPLVAIPRQTGPGTVVYTEFRTPWTWLEGTTGGTAVFCITDSTGATIGTANYTPDYQHGRITFGADQAGSARYLTARSYDVYEAAARIWESKAAHVADRYDFSADGASFKVSQLVEQYTRMAQQMRRESRSGGVTVGRLVRSDVAADY